MSIQNTNSIRLFEKYINFSSREKTKKLERLLKVIKHGWSHLDIIPVKKSFLYRELRKYFKKVPNSREFNLWLNCNEYITKNNLRKLIKYFRNFEKEKPEELKIFLDKLEFIINDNIIWTKIIKKTKFLSDVEFVYDLTVPGYSNYIANGFVTHNCDGGPAVMYIKQLFSKPECSLIFTGFQIPRTAGRYLQDTGRFVSEEFDLKIKMNTKFLDFSAHSGRTDLIEFVKRISPRKVICMHGEYCERFATELRGRFGIEAIAPNNGESVEV